MEKVTQATLDEFQRLTKYDVSVFFEDYIAFIEDDYSKIANYFSGKTKNPDTSAFDNLQKLIDQSIKTIDIFTVNADVLENHQYWILLEKIEDIIFVLETTNNLSKWLRSSATVHDGEYVRSVLVNYAAKQEESIEEIERNILSSSNVDEDWPETAIKNNLREEDYTAEGGYLIKAEFKNNDAINIAAVVDNIDTVEKTYGKDLLKILEFANNDLLTLEGIDCIKQSAGILAGLRKGDNPAFPDDGVDHKNILGNSLAGISYPSIFRQMAATFAKDDTFKSFAIKDVDRDKDGLKIEFDVETRAGDILNRSVSL